MLPILLIVTLGFLASVAVTAVALGIIDYLMLHSCLYLVFLSLQREVLRGIN
jgi:hypothetical protein